MSHFVLELDAIASAASRISMEINMGSVLHEHDDAVTWVVVTVAEMAVVVRYSTPTVTQRELLI